MQNAAYINKNYHAKDSINVPLLKQKFSIQCFETEEEARPKSVNDPSCTIELPDAIERLREQKKIFVRLQLDDNNVIVTKLSIALNWAKRERCKSIDNYVKTSSGYYYTNKKKALRELNSAMVFDIYERRYYYNDNFDTFLLTRKYTNVTSECMNETYPAADDDDLLALHEWLNTLEAIKTYENDRTIINNEFNRPKEFMSPSNPHELNNAEKSIVFRMTDGNKVIFTFKKDQESMEVDLTTLKWLFKEVGYNTTSNNISFISKGKLIEYLHDERIIPIENLNINDDIEEKPENRIHVIGTGKRNENAPEGYPSEYGNLVVKKRKNLGVVPKKNITLQDVHQDTTSNRKILCYSLLSILLLIGCLATPAMIGLKHMNWKFDVGFATTNQRLLTVSLTIVIGMAAIATCVGLIYSITRCCHNRDINADKSESELKPGN